MLTSATNLDHVTITIPAVGTIFLETTIPLMPRRFIIHRARAQITSGSGTTVAIRIREKTLSGASPAIIQVVDTVLEYSLTPTPLDSGEHAFFKSQEPAANNEDKGTIYISAKCDTSGNTVQVSLDIEQVQ